MGRTEGTAYGVVDENGPRWRNAVHNVKGCADFQCGDSVTFNDVGDETDGLVAEGSVGYEKRQIDLRALQLAGDSRSKFGFYLLVTPQPTHKRNVKRRKLADSSLVY